MEVWSQDPEQCVHVVKASLLPLHSISAQTLHYAQLFNLKKKYIYIYISRHPFPKTSFVSYILHKYILKSKLIPKLKQGTALLQTPPKAKQH